MKSFVLPAKPITSSVSGVNEAIDELLKEYVQEGRALQSENKEIDSVRYDSVRRTERLLNPDYAAEVSDALDEIYNLIGKIESRIENDEVKSTLMSVLYKINEVRYKPGNVRQKLIQLIIKLKTLTREFVMLCKDVEAKYRYLERLNKYISLLEKAIDFESRNY